MNERKTKTNDDGAVVVIGLGYVGLPLAVEFAKHRATIGFDVSKRRIDGLRQGHDETREVSDADFAAAAQGLTITDDPGDIKGARWYIVTVPTPVDADNVPDLSHLHAACATVGNAMGEGATVIFESTVFPGCTRNICVPLLEDASGLTMNEGFTVGYSPERINPGDHDRRLPSIVKVTSGSSEDAADAIDGLYRQIITAGTFKAQSIEVAEAAKVIENTQRDLNIALMNELSIIFNKLSIDTGAVLEAAGTKWNFLPFKPGLVGGHCIGVDPYYLTHRAQQVGYYPEIVLAGRRINNGMPRYLADRVLRLMIEKGVTPKNARVLVLGLTFKEECPDLRNSKVFDLIDCLKEYSLNVDVYDPFVADQNVPNVTMLTELPNDDQGNYDAVLLAVPHEELRNLGKDRLRSLVADNGILFDVKGALPLRWSDGRL